MITVFLADDHHVVRAEVRSILEAERDLSIVGEEADGLAVEAAAVASRAQVLVVDISLPGLGGLEITRRVKRRSPRTRVVVLTMHADDAYVAAAFRAGADAYVLKCSPPGELVSAVRAAMRGERFLGSPLSAKSVADWMRRTAHDGRSPLETLTPREREALQLAAEGLSNPEIALRLGIGVRTAETYRSNVLRKLGLRSHAELVRFMAHGEGAVPGDASAGGERPAGPGTVPGPAP